MAVLLLWATKPMLPRALEVTGAWGFTGRGPARSTSPHPKRCRDRKHRGATVHIVRAAPLVEESGGVDDRQFDESNSGS